MSKTIRVSEVVKKVNQMLAESTCSREERLAMCSVLETILFSTNNYRGYSFLSQKEVPAGEKPGIGMSPEGKTVFPDDSRRWYYGG